MENLMNQQEEKEFYLKDKMFLTQSSQRKLTELHREKKLCVFVSLREKIFLILLLAFLFSCKEKTVVIPDSVLSKDTMANVLMDIQLEEAIISKLGINDSLPKDSILKGFALIFQKHKISQEQFAKSFDYYKENPEMLEEIYDKVINELSEMQALIGNINSADAAKKEISEKKKETKEKIKKTPAEISKRKEKIPVQKSKK